MVDGGMGDAIGSKNTCNTCSTEFFDWRIQSKKSSFSTRSASRNSQSKNVESKKKPFFGCVRKPDLGFSRKRPFSTDKSDCMINGLTVTFRCFVSRVTFRQFHFGVTFRTFHVII